MTEDGKQMSEDRWRRSENPSSLFELRRDTSPWQAEGRRPKTDDRRQMSDVRCQMSECLRLPSPYGLLWLKPCASRRISSTLLWWP